MAQQLFYFILFLNNNIIITSNKIMWGITLEPLPHKVGPNEDVRDLSGGDCDTPI